MKTNPNDAVGVIQTWTHQTSGEIFYGDNGITKREYFAIKAMQGMLAGSTGGGYQNIDYDYFPRCAVKMADGLIKGLNEDAK